MRQTCLPQIYLGLHFTVKLLKQKQADTEEWHSKCYFVGLISGSQSEDCGTKRTNSAACCN